MNDFVGELLIFISRTKTKFIVFGGGISSKQKNRILELQDKFQKVKLRISSSGENTGLYGAFGLIKSFRD